MRILLVHNRYLQRGGEDVVFESERDLLIENGHDVEVLETNTSDDHRLFDRYRMAVNAVYSSSGRKKTKRAIQYFRPDVVHVHNTFPVLSPAVFDACLEQNIPSVYTLHNYRVSCVNALLMRQGAPCEDCISKIPWRGVIHRCYRDSFLASAVAASMITFHQYARTWQNKVSAFVALNEFSRQIYIRCGLPVERIHVKPNFVRRRKLGPRSSNDRSGYLYVGRLSSEKGIHTLLDAWRLVRVPLTIVGSGELEPSVEALARENELVSFVGYQPRENTIDLISRARALIVPSTCYENFPMTIAEAFACGTPVIASRIGALQFLVDDKYTGLHFSAGSPEELASRLRTFDDLSELELQSKIDECYKYYLEYLTPETNLECIQKIYSAAVADRS